jgi:uncharacterized membrane protein
VSTARAGRRVALTPERAFELWVDVSRWEAFVDGFRDVEQVDDAWPAVGATVVWRSIPSGRGRVVERVTACEPGVRFETDVTEDRLRGTQTVELQREAEGCAVRLSLEYSIGGGPLKWLTDVLFVRRAETDALDRTLARFAAEAEEL